MIPFEQISMLIWPYHNCYVQVDSTCRIDEYDESTQAALRKVMFDQRQKATGVVTSGDIESQNVLNMAQNIPGGPKI